MNKLLTRTGEKVPQWSQQQLDTPVAMELRKGDMSGGSSPSFPAIDTASPRVIPGVDNYSAKVIQNGARRPLTQDAQFQAGRVATAFFSALDFPTVPLLKGEITLLMRVKVKTAMGKVSNGFRRALGIIPFLNPKPKMFEKRILLEVTAKPHLKHLTDPFGARAEALKAEGLDVSATEVAKSPALWTDDMRHMAALTMIVDQWLLGDRDAGIWQYNQVKGSGSMFNTDVDSTFHIRGTEPVIDLKDKRLASTLLFLDYAERQHSLKDHGLVAEVEALAERDHGAKPYDIDWGMLREMAVKVQEMPDEQVKELLAPLNNTEEFEGHGSLLETLGYTDTPATRTSPKIAAFDKLTNDVLSRKRNMVATFEKFKKMVEDKCEGGLSIGDHAVLKEARINVELVDSELDQHMRHNTQKKVFGADEIVSDLNAQLDAQNAEKAEPEPETPSPVQAQPQAAG
jgi:hypothetical protein